MLVQLLKPEFQELIEAKNWVALKEVLTDVPAADISELLVELPGDIAVVVFRLLKKRKRPMSLQNCHRGKELS